MHKTESLVAEDMDSKFLCHQNVLLMTAIDEEAIEDTEKLLRESSESASAVVNVPCGRLQLTALQLAATKGKHGAQLVNLLLMNGAKANVSDKLGRTPLHSAALLGNEEAVQALLKAGAHVDSHFQVNSRPKQQLDNHSILHSDYSVDVECKEVTSRFNLPIPECWGRTPLHQAVKSGNPACVLLLLQAGAKVNAEDEKGTTPLLLAGAGVVPDNKNGVNKYEEIVELLVQAGAHVNVYNQDTGSTALHHAAVLRSVRAMQFLLDAGAVLEEGRTEGGVTVLHEAAKAGSVAMIELLLKQGADHLVNVKDKTGCTPLHKAAYVGARDCLTTLLRHGGDLAAQSSTNVSVMDVIFSHIPRPVHFLTDILNGSIIPNGASVNDRSFKQIRILQHPLLETFLRLKWHRLRMIFGMIVVVHACFVASLSTYCLLLVYNNNDSSFTAVVVSRRVLLVSVLVLFIHLLVQIMMLPRHYLLQYETWINLVCILLSLTIAVGGETTNYMMPFLQNREPTESTWVLHVMSFAVLLAWTELMLLMGRFPTCGYYALMFYQVLQNVIKVLLTFGGLVMGFAFSFCVQFHESGQFRNLWWSIVKTVVMMMGEYEYSDLFPEDDKMQLRLKGTSRIIFLAFVVLSSIVLMNLMVGLAVNDIQELQTEGHIQRLLKQAEFLAHCEKLSSHHILKSALFPSWFHKIFHDRRSIETLFVIQPSEISSGRKDLSFTLLESIIGIAIHNEQKSAGHDTRFSNDYHSVNKISSRSEYGSVSDRDTVASPMSSADHSSILTMLHQLQQDISDIRQALHLDEGMETVITTGRVAGNFNVRLNERQLGSQPMSVNRWTRPVAEIQEAQGILRRLQRKNNSRSTVV
ncbi:transient receptor potential channel pyrexia-like isoform X3 [Zootermopsis nevadensis]|uniref:transient receptor potential channel pyrexia-like isoform X3 n=1 Tax=Zootermopsis nevadensis TaxID=136037 RepID=UPI000B8E87AD|nr:transient receptor potential channel pyrexia-like isoform X3 [Zootermopsis nevadensis]